MTGSITGVSFPSSDFTAVAERIDDLESFEIAHAQALVRSLTAKRDAASPEHHDAASSSFALLLIDGLSIREEPVVSSLYSALGDIPLFGGSAGDDLKFEQTWVCMTAGSTPTPPCWCWSTRSAASPSSAPSISSVPTARWS